tara:strand:- start:10748 stop:11092 length:345 start_codon:yes stop_codon:yes gene_type:complete
METVRENFEENTGEYVVVGRFPKNNIEHNEIENIVQEEYINIVNQINNKQLNIIPNEYFYGVLCRPPSIQIAEQHNYYKFKITIHLMAIDITFQYVDNNIANNNIENNILPQAQ